MTQIANKKISRGQPLFPNQSSLAPETLLKHKQEREARQAIYQQIFDNISPSLLTDYYNWFIIIEPNSGDYFLDSDEQVAIAKARQKYSQGYLGIFRLNQTGVCGRI